MTILVDPPMQSLTEHTVVTGSNSSSSTKHSLSVHTKKKSAIVEGRLLIQLL